MNEVLTLDNKIVDIIPDSITRTLQINDLGSAEDRQSSFSNTIELPLTANNKIVFDFLGVNGNTSRNQYQSLPCTYTVKGVPLIVNGIADVKATSSHYEVVIYDGIIDLSEKLNNKTLADLNYSDLNHFLNPSTYLNSFDNEEGYIYAVGDFGLDRSGIQVERQVPSLFVSTLWDKIFSQSGIDYSGDFFINNEDFKTEVITPVQGYEVQDVEPTETNIGTFDTNQVNKVDTYIVSPEDDFLIGDLAEYFDFATTISDNRLTFNNDRITINENIRLKFSIDLDYFANDANDSFRIGINQNDNVSVHYLDPNKSTTNIDVTLDLVEGDEVYFLMSGTPVRDTQGVEDYYEVRFNGSASITISNLTGGFFINFNQMIGDMNQLDFIKDILYRYGLILKPVNNNTGYEFIQYEELLNSRNSANNWTDKLVNIESENYQSDYATVNKASYSYHEDIVVPSFDGNLTLDVTNIDSEKKLFESPYEIPTNYRVYRQNTMYYHPVWESKVEDGEEIIKVKEAPYKLFRINKIDSEILASFFTDGNSVNFNGLVPYLSLNNISLQYYLDQNYTAFRNVINSFKEVEMLLDLNVWDIYTLDFFKLIYFEQTGKYYYLNKIKYSSDSNVCDATLIEINEFSE